MTLRGTAETKAALARVEAEMKATAPAAARAGAEVVGSAAASNAPRNTGATANSIRVDSAGETAHVGPTTSWARFTELGTVYVGAQHWLQSAAESSTTGVVSAMASVLKAAIH